MTTMSAALGGFLTSVATTYAKAVDRKLSTVSLAAADDPNVLPRIAKAPGTANFTIDRFDRIISWFVEHWPLGARWPSPPAWPFPNVIIGANSNGKASKEHRGVAAEGRKAFKGNGKAKARKAAKPKQGAKGRKGRQRPQPAAGGAEHG